MYKVTVENETHEATFEVDAAQLRSALYARRLTGDLLPDLMYSDKILVNLLAAISVLEKASKPLPASDG